MKRKKARAVAEAEERARIQSEELERGLEREKAKWNDLLSPENIAKKRSEALANANPERKKELEELYRDADRPPMQKAQTKAESIVQGWEERFANLVENHPQFIAMAAQMEADLFLRARIVLAEVGVSGDELRIKAIKVCGGLMPMVFAIADAFAVEQSKKASKPRDRRPIHMAKTIKAMRRARRGAQSFNAFLRDAEAGDIDGLAIYPAPSRGLLDYDVVLDDASGQEISRHKVKRGTLSDWFTRATSPDSDKAG